MLLNDILLFKKQTKKQTNFKELQQKPNKDPYQSESTEGTLELVGAHRSLCIYSRALEVSSRQQTLCSTRSGLFRAVRAGCNNTTLQRRRITNLANAGVTAPVVV